MDVHAHLPRVRLSDLAGSQGAVNGALQALKDRQAIARMWAKDPALWKPAASDQSEIVDRLGWLDLPSTMSNRLAEVQEVVGQARAEGIRHVVLCGMGGSSLAPEVYRLTFGSHSGYPALIVLDSTDPGAVGLVDQAIDPARTLFVISSKSGGTIEVMSFLAHFWEAAGRRGERFCAVTDPDTGLERLARERGFRHVFVNPADVGGRYSALSLFGLVPAGFLGMPLDHVLRVADEERTLNAANVPEAHSPAAWLGAFMGGLASAGRDKLTLLTSPALASFGPWVEQLIAESTGKEGQGIIPVVDEPFAADPTAYGVDRAFAVLRLEGDENDALDQAIEVLRGRHPLVVHDLREPYDLAAEMYRWEAATALAGVVLGINPFDQPNVQESKENTSRVLAEAVRHGGVVPEPPAGVRLDSGDPDAIAGFLAEVEPGDYVAFQAYLTPTRQAEAFLRQLRTETRDRLGVATTVGFGPRFLHSTGQLHKGGPPSGIFLQLVSSPEADLPVPGQPYTFGTLLAAQALGDLTSLQSRGLRVARVGVPPAPDALGEDHDQQPHPRRDVLKER